MALLLYEAGLVQLFLAGGGLLLLPHLDFLLCLTLSEVPRPLLHLTKINEPTFNERYRDSVSTESSESGE